MPSKYDPETRAKAVRLVLDINLLFGANVAALGGIAALNSSGGQGVDVAGLDGETDMFTAIKNGQALATVIHKPTAGIVVDEIVQYLQGKPVPEYKLLPEDLVTKEAIDAGSSEPAF